MSEERRLRLGPEKATATAEEEDARVKRVFLIVDIDRRFGVGSYLGDAYLFSKRLSLIHSTSRLSSDESFL